MKQSHYLVWCFSWKKKESQEQIFIMKRAVSVTESLTEPDAVLLEKTVTLNIFAAKPGRLHDVVFCFLYWHTDFPVTFHSNVKYICYEAKV